MKINLFKSLKNSRLRIIWYFLKPYPHYLIGIVALSFANAFFEAINVLFIFSLLSTLMNVGAVGNLGGGVLKAVNMVVGILPIKDPLVAAASLLIASVILRNVFGYLQKVYSAYAGYKIWKNAQEKLFSKCISADYQYFLDHKHGELVYRILSAPGSLGVILKVVPQSLVEFARMLSIGTILIGLSPYASLIIISVGVSYYYFTKYIAKNISYNLGSGRAIAGEKQNIVLNEAISGIRQIKVFDAESRWTKKFFKALHDYFKLALADSRWTPLPASLLEAVTISMIAVVIILLRIYYPVNFLSIVPILGAFVYAFQKLMPSLSLLGNARIQLMGALPVVEILYAALNDKTNLIQDGKIEINDFENEIRFEDIYFSYPGREGVLKNVNMVFEKGKITAIVGPSGAGKSTVADLIARFFIPNSGRIMINNIDLKDCKISSWRRRMGFVTQDTFIFNDSIAGNITFGDDPGENMGKVIEAAKIANAHDFIREFPQGYNTIVGDRGMKLSGGQRQRLAIARAMYRKPELLIFDEATSSLDNVSEKVIQQTIQELARGHTVIIIAHRLSTVINADKIIVLDQGTISEEGTHQELVNKKSIYWSLYNLQKQPVGVAKANEE